MGPLDFDSIMEGIAEMSKVIREGAWIYCKCADCNTMRVLERREPMARDACRVFGDILTDPELERSVAVLADTDQVRHIPARKLAYIRK